MSWLRFECKKYISLIWSYNSAWNINSLSQNNKTSSDRWFLDWHFCFMIHGLKMSVKLLKYRWYLTPLKCSYKKNVLPGYPLKGCLSDQDSSKSIWIFIKQVFFCSKPIWIFMKMVFLNSYIVYHLTTCTHDWNVLTKTLEGRLLTKLDERY